MANAAALRKLSSLGLSNDQLAGVLDLLADMEEAEEQRLLAQRERKARNRAGQSRDSHGTVTDQGRDSPPPSLDKKAPHTPKELNPSAPASLTREGFADFWALFPNKVGKADASKAFDRAALRVDMGTMMAGLRRYVAKTDDRPWCNPATWLNQDRWTDEPAAHLARGSPAPKSRGIGGVFSEVVEHYEREQDDGYRGQQVAGTTVLSLPHRRAG